MSFSQLIAWRYIREQKRHSVLTICSIAIAVAMISMLFTGAGCLINTFRGHITDTEFPHHYAVLAVTDEQEAKIAGMYGIKAVGRYEPGSLATGAADCRYGKHSFAAFVDEMCAEIQTALQENPDLAEQAYHGAATHPIWIDFEFHLVVHDQYKETLYGAPDPEAIMEEIRKMYPEEIRGNIAEGNGLLLAADFMTMNTRMTMAILFAVFYVFVCFLALMLRLVIDTAFEISAKERERQFGMLQSVGATPQQIVKIMTHEGLMLSLVGIPLGLLIGIGLAWLVYRTGLSTDVLQWMWGSSSVVYDVPFRVSAFWLITAALTGLMWVFFSSYGTGTRVIRYSPIEAMHGRRKHIAKVHKHRLAGLLFGWTGKLAARNVRREPKRFLITVLSLTLAITLVSSTSMIVDSIAAGNEEEEFGDDDLYAWITPEDNQPLTYQTGVKKLEESGLFAAVSPSLNVNGFLMEEQETVTEGKRRPYGQIVPIQYVTEYDYALMFEEEEPPVPYSALNGKYLLMRVENVDPSDLAALRDAAIAKDESGITLTMKRELRITEEEAYAKAKAIFETDMQNKEYAENYDDDPDDTVQKIVDEYYSRSCTERNTADGTYTRTVTYYDIIQEKHTFPLAGIRTDTETDAGYLSCWLITAESTYTDGDYVFNTYADTGESMRDNYAVSCIMAREDQNDIHQAKLLLESLGKPDKVTVDDRITPRIQSERLRTTVKYVCNILMTLFALIAAVSMINIISTGILNRRSELGSMCTVGMTNGQLIRLTITECLQYVLTSGITAALLTMGLIYFTRRLLAELTLPELMVKYQILYSRPVPMLILSTLCAFAVAAVTTLLSLRRLTQEPLVDAIRNTE